MRARLAVLAVVTVALAAPAQAGAADHLWLSVNAVGLGDGWTLSASVTSPDFDPVSRNEILGVTLGKRWSARAHEAHALRLHHTRATIVFDGRHGRWRTAGLAGPSVAIDMTVTATGEPRAVAPGESLPFACRGSFIRRPVVLQGRFGVRTGTRAFGTIRRVRLTGVMTYDTGGPVECGSLGGSCDSETGLSASHGLASLIADPSKRTLVLSFPELNGWYHVMALSQLSVASAQLPTIRIGMPANVPVTGALTFSARETSELVEDGCPVVTATGDLAGRLRVRFTGWATRTFAASSATYRRTGPP